MGLRRSERTAISELARLFNGRDMGVHGFAVANGRLAGPLSQLAITGDLNITDVHRWDLMPPKGEGWTLNYQGLPQPAHKPSAECGNHRGTGTGSAGGGEIASRRLSCFPKVGRQHHLPRSSGRLAGGNGASHGRPLSARSSSGRPSERCSSRLLETWEAWKGSWRSRMLR